MAWYRTGTIALTNGSANVVGTGTAFVSNVTKGEALVAPDGRSYEVLAVVSDTALTLASNYLGATAGGQAYAVLPTQSFMRDLALQAADLIGSFADVRDRAGQGMFGAGTAAAPGVRNFADQDTGLYWAGANLLGLATGGVGALFVDGAGNVGVGTAAPISRLHLNVSAAATIYETIGNNSAAVRLGVSAAGLPQLLAYAGAPLVFGNDNLGGVQVEWGRFDATGNFLVGAATGSVHTVAKNGAVEGAAIFTVTNNSLSSVTFYTAVGTGANAANAAAKFNHCTTGRSINASGTINASGADYAEYMTKADGCGVIAKGDVCGVDVDGKLTKTWGAALSFVVKSTDPAYVGGDTWGGVAAPEAPAELDPAPVAFPDEAAEDFAERRAAWDAQAATHAEETAAYETAFAAWQVEHEAARAVVDRIAFSGQVPVNMTGDFAPGDYVIAAANGGGIEAVAVPAGEITFEQYRHRVGKIWADLGDGRAWVNVQHG